MGQSIQDHHVDCRDVITFGKYCVIQKNFDVPLGKLLHYFGALA